MTPTPLPHDAYRHPCPNPRCRNLSAEPGAYCCRRCADAHHSVYPRALRPAGIGGHEQPCAHAAQCRRTRMPGYIQPGDEVRCRRCHAWHVVVHLHDSCVVWCGHVITALGLDGEPYPAIVQRRRRSG